jgi:hypothetical protein
VTLEKRSSEAGAGDERQMMVCSVGGDTDGLSERGRISGAEYPFRAASASRTDVGMGFSSLLNEGVGTRSFLVGKY